MRYMLNKEILKYETTMSFWLSYHSIRHNVSGSTVYGYHEVLPKFSITSSSKIATSFYSYQYYHYYYNYLYLYFNSTAVDELRNMSLPTCYTADNNDGYVTLSLNITLNSDSLHHLGEYEIYINALITSNGTNYYADLHTIFAVTEGK